MISHEIAVIAAAALAAFTGFIFGRMRRVDADHPTPPPRKPQVSVAHPYRDAAAREPEGSKPPKAKRLKLHRYSNYENKIWLRCPACDGGVSEIKVCSCGKLASEDTLDEIHFHVDCPHCSLRFAMETRSAQAARQRERKKAGAEPEAKAESEEPKTESEPKAN